MNDLEKQRIIIRQSSIKAGLEFFAVNNRVCSLDELTSVAEALTTYVLEGRTEEYKKRLKGLDDKLK